MLVNDTKLRESLIDGVFRTRDGRFYAGASRLRDGVALQYLSEDGREEYVRVYVNSLQDAQTTIDQIIWAETEGRRG